MKRTLIPELGGHGQELGHELVSESVSEADWGTRFFEPSGTDLDTHKAFDVSLNVRTSMTSFIRPADSGEAPETSLHMVVP